MIRRPPRSTRTDTLFPYTTLFRSWLIELRSDTFSELSVIDGSRVKDGPSLSSNSTKTVGTRWPTSALKFSVTERDVRSEEHTSELQSLMRISYAVFCLKKKNNTKTYISLLE